MKMLGHFAQYIMRRGDLDHTPEKISEQHGSYR